MSTANPHENKEPHRPTDHQSRTVRRAQWGQWTKTQKRNKTVRGRKNDPTTTKWT